MKDFYKNVLLILGSLILSFLVLELIANFLSQPYIEQQRNWYEPIHRYSENKELIYELVPNSYSTYWGVPVRINSYGTRGKEFSFKKENGKFRILVLGDSVTFGLKVEEEKLYTSLLESKLNGYAGKNIYEVINAGVMGYAPVQEAYFLKEKGLDLNPDLVIIGFCLSNDFYLPRIVNKSYTEETVNVIEVVDRRIYYVILPKSKFSLWLMEHSKAYRLFNFKLESLLTNLGFNFVKDDYYKEGLEKTRQAFSLISEISREKKIPVLVVGFPFDVDNRKRKELLTYNANLLNNLTREYNFNFLDMSETFHTSNVPRKDIWVDGWVNGIHFNYTGHLIISELIFDYLIKEQLV